MVKGIARVQWCSWILILTGVCAVLGSPAYAQTDTASGTNLYDRIYTNSVSNLSKPDQTFIDITASPPEKPPVLYAAQSKTCSKRCSTRCSKSCTTTRGCSSNCKSYTDGCGGSSAPPQQTPAPQSSPNPDGVPRRSKLDIQPFSSPPSSDGQPAIPRSALDTYSLKDVKALLGIAGYQISSDGEMDATTQAAIVDFQRRNGLPQTGIADDALWRSLCSAITVLGGGSGVTQSSTTPSTGKGKYWINSGSNTRHNASCRYYGTTKQGYYTDDQVGKACGICGG